MGKVSEIKKHIEDKINSSQLNMLPFPHLIIEGFFPEEIYKDILKYNLFAKNKGKEWISKKNMLQMKTTTPYDHRKQINFHEEQDFEAGPTEKEFWNDIKECFLGDDWFIDLIYKKFPEYFQLRFGEFFSKEHLNEFKKQLFLQRHDYNYSIGPHTDVPTRVFTCIFSFAEGPGFEEWGTQLLRHKDPHVRCWGNNHYDFKDFEIVKTAPYKPNNFLLFFKTPQSFHAVKTVEEHVPNGRFGMQFQFYEKKGGVLKDLSLPGLMETDHMNFAGKLMKNGKNIISKKLLKKISSF